MRAHRSRSPGHPRRPGRSNRSGTGPTRADRSRAIFTLSAALLAVVSLAGACGGDDASSPGPSPRVYTSDDSAITVKNGAEFVVALEASPSTGYAWTAAGDVHYELIGTKQGTSSKLAGAPGTQRLTFKAVETGATDLRLVYSRSFEGGVPPAKTQSFRLTVEP